MSIRRFETVSYLPLLNVRPAEMRALEELTNRGKDQLLPYVFLCPWTTAHQLDSALSRIEQAYGDRPIVFDLSLPDIEGSRRPVHDELDELRGSNNGYENWCEFVARSEVAIPSIQIGVIAQVRDQVIFFRDLNREMVIRLPEQAFGAGANLARLLAELRVPPENVCFLLDFERSTREILGRAAVALGVINAIWGAFPGCFISLSSSSFPEGFDGLTRQEIYERLFFNAVLPQTDAARLIYSDRGSARAERQGGGGGQPLPRVDYALPNEWSFFREEPADSDDPSTRPPAYQAAAVRALDSESWDARLRIWGSQMIERTAAGDPDAIISPMRCTAARINIHLHRQLFYNDPGRLYDTDEDWRD